MPALGIVLDVEQTSFRAMREAGIVGTPGEQSIAEGKLIHLGDDASIEVGGLEGGMQSGAPSVAICFRLPDGRVVLAETSMTLFLTAADALKAKLGDPRV